MKNTRRRWAVQLIMAGMAGCLLTGCSWSIGGGHGATAMRQPTRGQELTDLKVARDQGAISEEEYQLQRRRILER